MSASFLHKIKFLLGPLIFAAIYWGFRPEGLSTSGIAILACTAWIATWWVLDVTHLTVTALLPIILFPLSGGLDLDTTTTQYGHKYIFLYIGGFVIAIALEKWNLHKRMAINIIHLIGTSISRIILGFMIATAFMSMWISNTATAVMMMPIAMAIITQLRDHPETPENENSIFGKAMMLAIAYSASIGGMATLIGTPPNLVLAGVIKSSYGVEITFTQWIMIGLPISVLLLLGTWIWLTKFSFRFQLKEFPGGMAEISRLKMALGKWSREEKVVSAVFLLTALLWIFRSLVAKWLPELDDTIIAIFSAMLLFLLPSKEGKPLLEWDEAAKLPWGIILLFGGGMAIAAGFQESGLADWIGSLFVNFKGLPLLLLLLLLVAAVNFLTEITSNLATTAMLLPILAPIALSLDVHPFVLMIGATLAASCAFMLPVATPPNAVVFGSGHLQIKDMVRVGFWMNILSIVIITIVVYYALGPLWGIDTTVFPEKFKR